MLTIGAACNLAPAILQAVLIGGINAAGADMLSLTGIVYQAMRQFEPTDFTPVVLIICERILLILRKHMLAFVAAITALAARPCCMLMLHPTEALAGIGIPSMSTFWMHIETAGAFTIIPEMVMLLAAGISIALAGLGIPLVAQIGHIALRAIMTIILLTIRPFVLAGPITCRAISIFIIVMGVELAAG